jgi:16S rRNA (cytidine1402-2'-O)-methyltransferase
MAGTLFIVATPIGNLGDLTARAAETLRQVAVVAAEDTRETRKLVQHAGSSARLLSLHSHAPAARLERCIEMLEAGSDLAFCTDAGTPGVSDPGPALVARALERGFRVVPIPGPSAVATALSVTGWPADRYVFMGFAPRKGGDRVTWLDRIRSSTEPVVCFEAGNRVGQLMTDLARVCGGDREVMIGREMTKRFEEFERGTAGDLDARLDGGAVRGEVTIVVGAGRRSDEPTEPKGADPVALARALVRTGLERSRIARVLAEVMNLPRNESYRVAMEATE